MRDTTQCRVSTLETCLLKRPQVCTLVCLLHVNLSLLICINVHVALLEWVPRQTSGPACNAMFRNTHACQNSHVCFALTLSCGAQKGPGMQACNPVCQEGMLDVLQAAMSRQVIEKPSNRCKAHLRRLMICTGASQ